MGSKKKVSIKMPILMNCDSIERSAWRSKRLAAKVAVENVVLTMVIKKFMKVSANNILTSAMRAGEMFMSLSRKRTIRTEGMNKKPTIPIFAYIVELKYSLAFLRSPFVRLTVIKRPAMEFKAIAAILA